MGNKRAGGWGGHYVGGVSGVCLHMESTWCHMQRHMNGELVLRLL